MSQINLNKDRKASRKEQCAPQTASKATSKDLALSCSVRSTSRPKQKEMQRKRVGMSRIVILKIFRMLMGMLLQVITYMQEATLLIIIVSPPLP